MPQVRLTAEGLDGPNPAFEEWQRLPADQQRLKPRPHHSIPKPPDTVIHCTPDEAAVLVGRHLGVLVEPTVSQSKPPTP